MLSPKDMTAAELQQMMDDNWKAWRQSKKMASGIIGGIKDLPSSLRETQTIVLDNPPPPPNERSGYAASLLEEVGSFTIKDSGQRAQFASGMVRDTTEGKTDYLLVRDGPLYRRWAEHLTKGAVKYAKRNWLKATGQEEFDRFRESAARHFEQWLRGDTDEDHAAAVVFGINGALYVEERMKQQQDAA